MLHPVPSPSPVIIGALSRRNNARLNSRPLLPKPDVLLPFRDREVEVVVVVASFVDEKDRDGSGWVEMGEMWLVEASNEKESKANGRRMLKDKVLSWRGGL